MPRTARFKIAAIEDLHRQLEYAPPETRHRQMDAAEALIADIDTKKNYPEDFIIYRITGYRPDRGDEPTTLVGQALLPDLVTFVQVLSEELNLSVDGLERPMIAMDELAERLNTSIKTIQRYRKQGLVCHYFVFPDGIKKLGCFEDSLKRFLNGRDGQLKKAARFTRIEPDVEAAIIEQARQLHRAEYLTLNEAALRLAEQYGRAHETIRLLLRRHDRRAEESGEAIFLERGPLRDREIILIHRAWQRGVEPAQLAMRLGKTKPTIHRAVNRRRRDLLRSVTLTFKKLPTFDRPDAETVILSAPSVVTGFEMGVATDAIRFLEGLQAASTPTLDVAYALLAAFNLLKRRVSKGIASLGEWPDSEMLDGIETDLRWIAMLERRLVMLGLPAAVMRIEQNIRRPLREQAGEEIVELIQLAVGVVVGAIESIDSGRGQRLERVVGLAMDKALARIVVIPQAGSRASARHAGGSIALGDLFLKVSPWERWLGLRRDLRSHVATLESVERQIIGLRYGLEGERPRTMLSIAKQLNLSPVKTVRLAQKAVRRLRSLVRQEL